MYSRILLKSASAGACSAEGSALSDAVSALFECLVILSTDTVRPSTPSVCRWKNLAA
jgi:hypothetical protein